MSAPTDDGMACAVRRGLAAGVLALLLVGAHAGCAAASPEVSFAYGVFIGLEPEDAGKLEGYGTVVIDAAYFTREQVGALRRRGQTVYSYLNIGSVEDFRDYYARFEPITLDAYEGWPGERWVDVADTAWRDFVCSVLAKDLAGKGISGFFVDNADVYYLYPTEEIYQGVLDMLSRLSAYGLDVVVNGGDTLMSEAVARGALEGLGVTGVNQECVYTAIDFESGGFYRQPEEETDYFKDYLSLCKSRGLAVFVTEYAAPSEAALREEIAAFCAGNGYEGYISSTLELTGTAPFEEP